MKTTPKTLDGLTHWWLRFATDPKTTSHNLIGTQQTEFRLQVRVKKLTYVTTTKIDETYKHTSVDIEGLVVDTLCRQMCEHLKSQGNPLPLDTYRHGYDLAFKALCCGVGPYEYRQVVDVCGCYPSFSYTALMGVMGVKLSSIPEEKIKAILNKEGHNVW